VNDQDLRYARFRHIATAAAAALAAVGAIAGTAALAATPRASTPGHAAVANNCTKPLPPGNGSTKTPAPASAARHSYRRPTTPTTRS
jgi:hypothetical protein